MNYNRWSGLRPNGNLQTHQISASLDVGDVQKPHPTYSYGSFLPNALHFREEMLKSNHPLYQTSIPQNEHRGSKWIFNGTQSWLLIKERFILMGPNEEVIK